MMARRRAHADRLIVIGGGLVGAVLALYLRRRGFGVTMYEQGSDGRKPSHSTRPSLSLSLCARGIASLRRVGVMNGIRPWLAPAFGRMIHHPDGTADYQAYSAFGDAIQCVSRPALRAELLKAAETHGVEIMFERRCVDVDPEAGRVVLEDRDGKQMLDDARAVFATDGSASAIRRRLQDRGYCQSTESMSPEGYKEFRIPVETARRAGLSGDMLHAWPRQQVIVGAFPEPDGSFVGTLHMNVSGPASFESRSNPSIVDDWMRQECQDLARAVPNLGEQIARQRPNRLVTVRCRGWSAGRVLLLGDAAHAMLPYYGQGANAGFEDCEMIDDLLETRGADWPLVFHEFESSRKPDTDAMADLCHAHLSVLRDGVSRPDYHAEWIFEQQLHRLMPELFTPLYSMIAFSSVRYAEALRRERIQQPVIRELFRQPEIHGLIGDPTAVATLRQRVHLHFAQAALHDRALRLVGSNQERTHA